MSIRTALGAKRWRIARQLLTESLMLACLGGVVGLLIAIWGVEFLLGLAPQTLSQMQGVSVDGRVLLFTLFVAIVTGTVFGLVPALHASRGQPGASLKEGSRGASGVLVHAIFRSAPGVSDVALALVLLVGAGLLMRSFRA